MQRETWHPALDLPEDAALTLYGATDCEDTALVRSRLAHLDVPYRWIDLDTDPAAADRVRRLNGGDRVTPTLVRHGAAIAEPSLEQLDRVLAAIRPGLAAPRGEQLHGALAGRAIPIRALVRSTVGGPDAYRLETLRGRRESVLFLAHAAGCLACLGYARQLALRFAERPDVDAAVIVAVPERTERLDAWRHALPDPSVLVGDGGGTWTSEVRARVGIAPDRVALVLLDRFLAPRVRSAGEEAGALIGAGDAIEWLEYLGVECGDCAPDGAWAE